MSQELTIEGNRLIAEFMGLHYNKYNQWSKIEDLVILDGEEYSENWIRELNYNTSWNELMPVISKIRSIAIMKPNWIIYSIRETLDFSLLSCNINATWDAVVEFIKRYNQKKLSILSTYY